jgi:hypothetical protein
MSVRVAFAHDAVVWVMIALALPLAWLPSWPRRRLEKLHGG